MFSVLLLLPVFWVQIFPLTLYSWIHTIYILSLGQKTHIETGNIIDCFICVCYICMKVYSKNSVRGKGVHVKVLVESVTFMSGLA
jgi:hypothetical protein